MARKERQPMAQKPQRLVQDQLVDELLADPSQRAQDCKVIVGWLRKESACRVLWRLLSNT